MEWDRDIPWHWNLSILMGFDNPSQLEYWFSPGKWEPKTIRHTILAYKAREEFRECCRVFVWYSLKGMPIPMYFGNKYNELCKLNARSYL